MSFALINKQNNNVCQFVATEDDCFETHEDYFWKDIPDESIEGMEAPDFTYEPSTGAIIKIVYPDPDYHLQRRLDNKSNQGEVYRVNYVTVKCCYLTGQYADIWR